MNHRYFTSALAVTVVLSMTAHAATYTWGPSGNPDGSGSWNVGTNWDLGTVPGAADTAVLPAATSSRAVTVDAVSAVGTLQWPSGSAASSLTLNADLSIDLLDTFRTNNSLVVSAGRTLVVKANGDWSKVPYFQGTGTIAKEGVNTFHLGFDNMTHPFTGTIEVREGKTYIGNYYGYFAACPEVKVTSSGATHGTFEMNIGATPHYLPQHFTISGPGFNNGGALRWLGGTAFTRGITVQNDASAYVAAGQTVTLGAALDGSATLTLFGGGALAIESTTSAHDGTIIVDGSTLTVPGLLADVTQITLLNGAVLNGAQCHFPNATVNDAGGTWNSTDASATWTGAGDGTSWSDAGNWSCQVPEGIEAIIPAAATGTIVVDVASSVAKLTWPASTAANTIALNADLTIDLLDTFRNGPNNLLVNGGATLIVDDNTSWDNTPVFQGSGTIAKDGLGTFYLGFDNTTHPFTGIIEVREGKTYIGNYYGNYAACPEVEVMSSGSTHGTFEMNIGATPHYLPQHFTISGPGFNDGGALRWLASVAFPRAITVQNAASVYIAAGTTVAYSGALDGAGVMTLTGGGTLDLNNTWNYAVVDDSANSIVIDSGAIDISGATLAITLSGCQGLIEYVIIDGQSSVTGQFATVTGLPAGASIDYDGTATHPNAVVLVIPPCDCAPVQAAVAGILCGQWTGGALPTSTSEALAELLAVIDAQLAVFGCSPCSPCRDQILQNLQP